MGFLFFGRKKKKQNKVESNTTNKTNTVEETKNVESKKQEAPVEKQEPKQESKNTNTENIETTKEETTDERVTKVLHVTPHPDGGWQIKGNNHKKALKRFDTQAEAIAEAKIMADSRGINYMIHKKDGRVRKKRYDK